MLDSRAVFDWSVATTGPERVGPCLAVGDFSFWLIKVVGRTSLDVAYHQWMCDFLAEKNQIDFSRGLSGNAVECSWELGLFSSF